MHRGLYARKNGSTYDLNQLIEKTYSNDYKKVINIINMTNKLVRANIQGANSQSFDEYGDQNPVYKLKVNGQTLTLKTRGKMLPSSIDFSQKFEFIFEITPANEIIAFYSPLQDLKWGNQSNIRTLSGSSKKPKLIYQFVSGMVTNKSSKSETVNTHQEKFGMENKTLEKRTTYFINISGQVLSGSSSYKRVKVGDKVDGVSNQYGYLELLKNTQTGRTYGFISFWLMAFGMVFAILFTIAINIFFYKDESLMEPVKTVFGEFPAYYEKLMFFNLLAIPGTIMFIVWTWQKFKVLRFYNQNAK